MCELREEDSLGGRSQRDFPRSEDRRHMGDTPEPGAACDEDNSAASSATVNSKHDEELQTHLPEGSVYTWAAMLDGATTSDAIVGWIILLVSAPSCC